MARSAVSVLFTGGFGNQLFQYAFARAYAETYGAVLLTPPWIGQKIFELSTPLSDHTLPNAGFDEIPNGRVNITLNGYFQNQTAINFMSRHKLKSWLRLRSEWEHRFTTRPLIAAHVRRGDYIGLDNIYCLISESSYITACKKFGFDVNHINWVQEGNKRPTQDLIDSGISFLEDFMLLMNANVLLRANSSFSWWAGALGSGRTFSPLVEGRTGMQDVDFVEGNWPRMVDGHNCRSNVSDLHLKD